MIGKTLNHFKVLDRLGKGGMGEVYVAQDNRLKRRVALKVLPAEMSGDPVRLERFQREAETIAALNHPNIVTIFSIEEADDVRFLTMELVEGDTLTQLIPSRGLDFESFLRFSTPVAEALSAAHEKGIIHRDLKPGNIMVSHEGRIKVLDFGLAKLMQADSDPGSSHVETRARTEDGIVLGTMPYMSPEQVQGKRLDQRSDIFSLGIVFYEMITGCRPFQGDTSADLISSILRDTPDPVSDMKAELPEHLGRIIRRCLMKDPRDRYQTVRDVYNELRDLTATSGSSSRSRTAALPVAAKFLSIAVLPFANMSADSENEYFCDGLAEELLNALTKLERLHVAARTSSFAFKNARADVREIGTKLNVASVLEGSVRKSGNRLRITAQLIKVADGYHLWSERYDRELKDIFDVQDEITMAIVDALRIHLAGEEKAVLLKHHTSNTDAYELYLKGLYEYNKLNEAGLRQSIEFYRQAIELDRNYAVAWSAIADSCQSLSYYGFSDPVTIAEQWKKAANRSLALDDTLAETHLSQALFHFYCEWDFDEAEREFKRTIELDPNHSDARQHYGLFLVSRGRYPEAVEQAKRAQSLDTLSLLGSCNVAWVFWAANRPDDLLAYGLESVEKNPDSYVAHWVLGWAYWLLARHDDAASELAKGIALDAIPELIANYGAVCAEAGKREEAEKVLAQLMQLRKERYTPAADIAWVFGSLGRTDEAIEWFEKACEERNGFLLWLREERLLPNLRKDPRFQSLLRRVGFEP